MSRLATITDGVGERPVAWVGDELLDLQHAFSLGLLASRPTSVLQVLVTESTLLETERLVRTLQEAPDERRADLRERRVLLAAKDVIWRAPLRPRLIICSGHTYSAHAREMGAKAPSHPAGFIKSSHCVIGPGEPIVLPREHSTMVDFEGEFAVVIGRACHNVSASEAMNYIAGYVLVNDVSARDWVADARATGDMFFNTLGKQFPTFCPLGPAVATANEIKELAAVLLTTTVNGALMQLASLSELTFSVPEIVSFWSRWHEFMPGDVVTTGSPPGVGAARTPPIYLQAGDHIEIEATGVGKLWNDVAHSPKASS